MSSCLVILHARQIREFEIATAELQIPKLWLTGYTERELSDGVFRWALEESDYDNYIVVSDDALVRQHALDGVVTALETGGIEVATGYSQRSHTDWMVNVTSGPLKDSKPSIDAYQFRQFREVVSWPEPLVPTWFTGMSLTGMSKEMWRRFPFQCYADGVMDNGYASDFNLSRRLQDERIPVYAVRESFCYHWRAEWRHTNHPEDASPLIGVIGPAVTLHDAEVTA